MKLILTRHGETFHNLKKITQGQFNSQLTPIGLEQAKKVAKRLKDEKIDIIITSDLQRCVDTANEIARFHPDIEIKYSAAIREQAKGIWENTPKNEKWYSYIKKFPWNKSEYEGGETFETVWKRITSFLAEIKEKYVDKSVLIVSHGGPLQIVFEYLEGKNLEDVGKYVKVHNTSITEIDISKDKVEFLRLNSLDHLGE